MFSTYSYFYYYHHLITLLCYCITSFSLPSPSSDTPSSISSLSSLPSSDWALNVDTIILGVIFLITGLAFCFFGGKLFRLCLFIAGAYLCAIFAVALVARFEPTIGFSNPRLVYFLVVAIVGIIGGCLFLFFYKLGLFAIGALGGYTIALFLLTLKSNGLISNTWGQFVFIFILAIIGGIAALIIEPHAVRIATSIGGAYLTILGIDIFTKLGFAAAARQFISQPSLSFEANGKVYGMTAAFIILSIVGIVVQYKKTSRHYIGSRSLTKS